MAKKVMGQDGKMYKVNKPFYKAVWFWVLVVLIIGGISSMSHDDEKGSATATSVDSDKKTKASTEKIATKKAKEPKKKEFAVGEPVNVEGVVYTINSKEVADSVGTNEYDTKNAQNKYLILNVTIQNNKNEAITIDNDFFLLYRGKTEFKSDSTATMRANEHYADFFYNELNPENSISGNIVFDVSDDTINDPATQVQVQTGAWGTEKERINLN